MTSEHAAPDDHAVDIDRHVRVYITVFVALMVLTVVTVAISRFHLPVPIAVTVLDRKGQPVTDLTQADFTVIENKKPREIVNFLLQRYEPGPVPPPATSTSS